MLDDEQAWPEGLQADTSPEQPLAATGAAQALPGEGEALVVDLAGFEGPLDLLLHLARNQRVDLARLSVLSLAEQYIAFVARARHLRLELAADYLVMAAWLAYLKSRLLLPLPKKQDDEPSGEEMAEALARRLQRLEEVRTLAQALSERPRLGRDVFARGAPEHAPVEGGRRFDAALFDLVEAYARLRQRPAETRVTIARRAVWSLAEARLTLARLLQEAPGRWTRLDAFLLDYLAEPQARVTALASAFAASLELVREGRMDMRQSCAFAPIEMRGGRRRFSEEDIRRMEAAHEG
ncbi:segregation/condensation protein A [Rhizobium rhizosphaerae]|uniref:Segregation and condensation protein A n=1 Tax=Xaviernesmea rhizosphaerae TaxID=1672749 RepID=A0ABX3PIQ3_9HYPH|nr:ScpA family protein [Xaviernesmea rhizosphaerae]OQP88042.1 segregation/condensation protein A [Xaviernesmea rhizosphaerae]